MITLHFPYKLERKVLFEKTGINTEDDIKHNFEKMNSKNKIAIFISSIISMFFAYITTAFFALNYNLIFWSTPSRFMFLIISLIGTALTYFYCSYQVSMRYDTENKRYNEIEIKSLTINWFKKLLSIFVFYFFTVFGFSLIIIFCTMSIDITKMSDGERAIMGLFFYIGTIIFCLLAYNNNLKFILKIEQ
nr:hypothetical protein [uncultured archaeon]